MNNTPIIIERTFNASVDKVWAAITDKAQMKEWYFDLAEFKAEPGFEFQFYGEGKEARPPARSDHSGGDDPVGRGENYLHLCTVQEAIVNKKLSYTWRYDGYKGNSLVSFELVPEGNKTKLVLTHSGLETFPATTKAFAKENFVDGWTHIINIALKNYLEKS
ncbi:MAG: SRPBCC domain-containing protein [Chitinophagaceae bacterium]